MRFDFPAGAPIWRRLPQPREHRHAIHEIDAPRRCATVPLIIYNASGTLPPADSIRTNFDITRTVYRD
jgi:hypothetical protein